MLYVLVIVSYFLGMYYLNKKLPKTGIPYGLGVVLLICLFVPNMKYQYKTDDLHKIEDDKGIPHTVMLSSNGKESKFDYVMLIGVDNGTRIKEVKPPSNKIKIREKNSDKSELVISKGKTIVGYYNDKILNSLFKEREERQLKRVLNSSYLVDYELHIPKDSISTELGHPKGVNVWD